MSKDRAKNKVVLVDFYAEYVSTSSLVYRTFHRAFFVHNSWCNPCKMLSPILEELTKDDSVQSGSGRSLDLVTVDSGIVLFFLFLVH